MESSRAVLCLLEEGIVVVVFPFGCLVAVAGAGGQLGLWF